MVKTNQRNLEICRRYRAGESAQAIGDSLTPRISRQRVLQILRSRGVTQEDRTTKSDEDGELLGVILSKEDKQAVREEAAERGISMSALTADLIKEMLARKKEKNDAVGSH